MIKILMIITAAALLLVSCNSEPTVQKYFVEKAEAKDFVAFDIAPSILKTDKYNLTAEEQSALKSIHNVNVLVFKANKDNTATFEKEADAAKGLLKTDDYESLIKVNTQGFIASINTKGEGNNIEEFVVYAQQPENGFGLIRVSGNNMTPNNVMTIASIIQKSGIKADQFKALEQLMPNKQ